MKKFAKIFILLFSCYAFGGGYPAPKQGCLACHDGIEPFKPHDSEMSKQIYAMSDSLGDPNGCVLCHGGNPKEIKDKLKAHKGAPEGSQLKEFTTVPGALNLNANTCGLCHANQVSSMPKSLMNTDAGKIKVITFGWGLDTQDDLHRYANHHTLDADGNVSIYGNDTYKKYMLALKEQHKNQFPDELKKIPATEMDKLAADPNSAIYNYLRNCNACHVEGKGKQQRGHYRGMGCSACHVPYGAEGFYEGKDKSIDKTKPGHMLVHSMQAGRNSPVNVGDGNYTGINISTCNACHSSGRRVSLQYQGLFPVDRGGKYIPFDQNGVLQQPNATYLYKHIKEDVHYKAGMLCQDCHTSPDMHGNGNIGTVALGNIEIECQDCHGTPQKYPWELPLGTGEKLLDISKITDPNLIKRLKEARGLSDVQDEQTENYGSKFDKKDGFLLSARGNPLGNVVKDGGKVIIHLANGKDLNVPVLKDIEAKNAWKNPKGRLAMVATPSHLEKMECYACHATWASSYYGYDYSIDFSKGQKMIDWVESAEKVGKDGKTADATGKHVMQKGGSDGDYSHARWEDPILGINGEGMVTPLVGVIQTVGTVIDEKGKVLLQNNVAKTTDGKLAIDMQPMNPHTSTLQARDCTECHLNNKNMGFGIDGGEPQKAVFMDIKDANGKVLTKNHNVQIAPIKNIENGSFMQILDANGTQVMSVDPHFSSGGALSKEQIQILKDENYMQKAQDSLKKLCK
ncbi:multiheme c-type cytochrome [Campylobacter fetus]|uniref:multiheme c-type cytochrome n=1 Tax=Campylobacter fetus TaxID=196 RepID=UPI0008189B65|nr:multiheme c-type cytochrome [Campylobacter fetus]OCR93304.1 hypothetical protein CFT12S02263_01555 [Campylobacter fetus subsp. testudinum]